MKQGTGITGARCIMAPGAPHRSMPPRRSAAGVRRAVSQAECPGSAPRLRPLPRAAPHTKGQSDTHKSPSKRLQRSRRGVHRVRPCHTNGRSRSLCGARARRHHVPQRIGCGCAHALACPRTPAAAASPKWAATHGSSLIRSALHPVHAAPLSLPRCQSTPRRPAPPPARRAPSSHTRRARAALPQTCPRCAQRHLRGRVLKRSPRSARKRDRVVAKALCTGPARRLRKLDPCICYIGPF